MSIKFVMTMLVLWMAMQSSKKSQVENTPLCFLTLFQLLSCCSTECEELT